MNIFVPNGGYQYVKDTGQRDGFGPLAKSGVFHWSALKGQVNETNFSNFLYKSVQHIDPLHNYSSFSDFGVDSRKYL